MSCTRFEPMVLPDARPLLNLFDCPLYNLSRTIFSVDSAIARPVSMVHRCGSSCQCWICSEPKSDLLPFGGVSGSVKKPVNSSLRIVYGPDSEKNFFVVHSKRQASVVYEHVFYATCYTL